MSSIQCYSKKFEKVMAAMLVCKYILGASAVQLAGEQVSNSSGNDPGRYAGEAGESVAEEGHTNVANVHRIEQFFKLGVININLYDCFACYTYTGFDFQRRC